VTIRISEHAKFFEWQCIMDFKRERIRMDGEKLMNGFSVVGLHSSMFLEEVGRWHTVEIEEWILLWIGPIWRSHLVSGKDDEEGYYSLWDDGSDPSNLSLAIAVTAEVGRKKPEPSLWLWLGRSLWLVWSCPLTLGALVSFSLSTDNHFLPLPS